jgi:hypothetical protein
MAVKKVVKDNIEVTEDVVVEDKVEDVVENTSKEVVEEDSPVVVEEKEIDEGNKPESISRICMRENHKCYIGGELYVLEKGRTYNVPDGVKKILNKAGLLSPL